MTNQAYAHAHANSTHPSAYSSMPSRSNSNKYTNAADKLEQSAKSLNKSTKDYLREVKHYDSEEDEVMMKLGLAMSSKSIKHPNNTGTHANMNKHTGNQSGGRKAHEIQTGGTFEETLSSDIQADVTHPAGKEFHHADQHHQQELISSLCEELKGQPSAASTSRLSQHASDAIRMVESHSILKQDKAPVHNVRDEDPAEKAVRYQKRH
ncbi:hypothetical protein EC957_005376 [Mortierella hygrophila]|uniref:Uncharacterized protein n=1 Tax=Mortierella hygrophila TaxID=979708 RepID=A0A9P6F0C9_9FUNG|nr:hypothetical protein EC957_005376 [Mortierella hygrophila]